MISLSFYISGIWNYTRASEIAILKSTGHALGNKRGTRKKKKKKKKSIVNQKYYNQKDI